jgi:CO/xanthine dehydrogenase Mo-binding subunit
MLKAVGRNVPRKEGRDKVSGASRYIDDLSFPNLLHARTIRSTIPAGVIADISFPFDTNGFTIVDFNDIPGRNVVALIDDDQPCLAERTIRHVAEPILILAHDDRDRLRAADVRVAYRSGTPNYDPSASPLCFKSIAIDKGDLDAGLAEADEIVEGEMGSARGAALHRFTGVAAVPGRRRLGRSGQARCSARTRPSR